VNCHEVDELAAAYVLFALGLDERTAVDEHLATCDAHVQTLAQLRTAAALLPASVYEIEPPPRLRQALGARIRGQRALSSPEQARRLHFQAVRALFGRPATIAIICLCLALAAFSGLQTYRALTAPADVFTRELAASDGATAQIVYLESHEVGVIKITGLAALPPEQTYQLWSSKRGSVESRGVLTTLQSGSGASVMYGDIPPKGSVFVTIELAGGSDQPTGPTVLSTDFRRR